MSIIKNIHLLDPVLSDKDREKLEAGAALHKRMSNITFKILEVTDTALTVRVTQEKHMSENYADKKTLVTRARELFGKFLPDRKIHPQAIPYVPNPVSEIDGAWVKKQMEKHAVRVTDLVDDTGVDKTNISAWANSTRPMSQPVKAMFFFYFLARTLKDKLG